MGWGGLHRIFGFVLCNDWWVHRLSNTRTSAPGRAARLGLPQLLGSFFGLVFVIHTFLLLAQLALLSTWMVLVAALNPTKYLAYGVAVATTGITIYRQVTKMMKMATNMKDIIMDVFSKVASELLGGESAQPKARQHTRFLLRCEF